MQMTHVAPPRAARLRGRVARGAVMLSLLAGGLAATVSQAPSAAAAPATTVSLSADATSVETGTVVTFTARVNGDIQPGQYIDIVNMTDGYYVATCEYPDPDWTCTGYDWFDDPGSHTYVAYIDNDDVG